MKAAVSASKRLSRVRARLRALPVIPPHPGVRRQAGGPGEIVVVCQYCLEKDERVPLEARPFRYRGVHGRTWHCPRCGEQCGFQYEVERSRVGKRFKKAKARLEARQKLYEGAKRKDGTRRPGSLKK